jgi:hypothetical protein
MQLIITQPVFVWIFGIVGVLFAIILVLVVVAMTYIVTLLKLANEKSKDVAETVDEVRHSVHEVVSSFDAARAHVASFVGAAVQAGTIANIVRSARNAWHGNGGTEQKSTETVDDVFKDVSIKAKATKRPNQQRSS